MGSEVWGLRVWGWELGVGVSRGTWMLLPAPVPVAAEVGLH